MSDRDLLDERMDQRLTGAGERWRATLPGATVPPAMQSQRRNWGAASAAVAVLLLVGGILAVTQLGDREPRGATTDPTTVLPRACGTGDLVNGGNLFSQTRGTDFVTAALELAPDREPCTVAGYPDVVVLGDPDDVDTVTDSDLGQPGELLVLPDRPVQVTLSWTPDHYCPLVLNTAIRLRVGNEVGVVVDGFGHTECRPGDGRPPVHVGAYAYVDPEDRFGTVTGVVQLETGKLVTVGTLGFDDKSSGDGDATSIEPDGSYQLRLPTGEYDVTVASPQKDDGRHYDAGTFEVVGGETNEIDLVIPVD